MNGGNLLLLGGTGKSLQQAFQELGSTFRWSVVSGAGAGRGRAEQRQMLRVANIRHAHPPPLSVLCVSSRFVAALHLYVQHYSRKLAPLPPADGHAAAAAGLRCQGAGLVWPTRIGRLELNVCQVLTGQEHDKVKRGIQFGFTPPAF